jgi:hypothetical protein
VMSSKYYTSPRHRELHRSVATQKIPLYYEYLLDCRVTVFLAKTRWGESARKYHNQNYNAFAIIALTKPYANT